MAYVPAGEFKARTSGLQGIQVLDRSKYTSARRSNGLIGFTSIMYPLPPSPEGPRPVPAPAVDDVARGVKSFGSADFLIYNSFQGYNYNQLLFMVGIRLLLPSTNSYLRPSTKDCIRYITSPPIGRLSTSSLVQAASAAGSAPRLLFLMDIP